MGKNLVIIGADFSENGIKNIIPLIPSWTDSKAWAAVDGTYFGQLRNSIQFKASNKIELPIRRNTLKYTRCVFTTSSGGDSGFGLVFWDSSDNPISGDTVPIGERGVTIEEISIPSNAVYVSFSYFMETDIPFSAEVL